MMRQIISKNKGRKRICIENFYFCMIFLKALGHYRRKYYRKVLPNCSREAHLRIVKTPEDCPRIFMGSIVFGRDQDRVPQFSCSWWIIFLCQMNQPYSATAPRFYDVVSSDPERMMGSIIRTRSIR
ncbi:unnamed protein product [Amoebophrya sp. A25]|nr:unnamed protein product [Amoebophrya sp. A25]|eukprot:GSA25T00011762001.1